MNKDFAPFELAVKLKEKGFDSLCIYAYCEQGGWNKYRQVHEPITHILRTDGNPFGSFYCGKNWNVKYETNKNKIRCSAPTISQVLKWLRKEKKIHIVYPFYKDKGFYYYVQRIGNAARIVSSFGDSDDCFDTAEQAALAGIEYVLDNLI